MTYFISKSHGHGHGHGDHGHGHGDHGHEDHGHHKEHHWLTECLLSKVWFLEYKSQVSLMGTNSLIGIEFQLVRDGLKSIKRVDFEK